MCTTKKDYKLSLALQNFILMSINFVKYNFFI